jgi:hypothetical protein
MNKHTGRVQEIKQTDVKETNENFLLQIRLNINTVSCKGGLILGRPDTLSLQMLLSLKSLKHSIHLFTYNVSRYKTSLQSTNCTY